MSTLQPSHPIFASRLRKRFNKEYAFSIGDLIKSHDETIAEFQGISTYSDRTKIAVNAYKVDEIAGKEVHELPKKFLFAGREIPVQVQVTDRPKITDRPSYGSGYSYGWREW